jgi:hypothetical protein
MEIIMCRLFMLILQVAKSGWDRVYGWMWPSRTLAQVKKKKNR